MKKKLVIILALTLLVGLLCGCAPVSNERLVVNVVYAKSEDAIGNDPIAKPTADDMTALRTKYPSLSEKESGKDFYCKDGNYSETAAEAAKNADIVICVGEELKDLAGVAASNPKVKWIWVGGDEAQASDSIYVIPAEDAAAGGALLTKLSEFIEHDTASDYVWSAAKTAETAVQTTEATSAEETVG